MELPPSVKRSISEEEGGKTTVREQRASAVFSRALNDKDTHVQCIHIVAHSTHKQNILSKTR